MHIREGDLQWPQQNTPHSYLARISNTAVMRVVSVLIALAATVMAQEGFDGPFGIISPTVNQTIGLTDVSAYLLSNRPIANSHAAVQRDAGDRSQYRQRVHAIY